MLNIQSLIRFPILKPKFSDRLIIESMIDHLSDNYNPMIQKAIDSTIFSLYGFDKKEIDVINDI